jgi:mRNA-degrading endonuclease RelE of RelBE toxin-antitoxin system
MEVVLSERVQIALSGASSDERIQVQTWIQYLRNWETDEFVRGNSVLLPLPDRTVYVFRTTTNLRIFFTVDEATKTITVIDVATRESILQFGGAAKAGDA